MFFLRYLPEVPLKDRKHEPTLGRFDTWLDAETARESRLRHELLEVVER